MSRSFRALLAWCLLLGFASTLGAQTATLTAGNGTASIGSTVEISLIANASLDFDGFSLGLSHAAELSLVGTPVLGAALDTTQGGAFDPAFAQIDFASALNGDLGFTTGIVFDFGLQSQLPALTDHEVIRATYEVGATATPGQSLALTFTNELAPPNNPTVTTVLVLGTSEAGIGNGLTVVSGSIDVPSPQFLRGDTNESGAITLIDAILILRFLTGAPDPVNCFDAHDVNGGGDLDIVDPMHLLMFLYAAGAPPASPFPTCGTPASYPLGCDSHGACP